MKKKKDSTCQCGAREFDPWSGKISHAMGNQVFTGTTTTEPVLSSLQAATTEAHTS